MLYSRNERNIAKFFEEYPLLKKAVKYLYQRFNYILHRHHSAFQSRWAINLIRDKRGESFFGYYDKSPANSRGIILFHQSPNLKTTRLPNPAYPLSIMSYDLKCQKYKEIAQTKAYNWQQGARLQWLDDNVFIFNDFDSERRRFIARVFESQTCRELYQVDSAVYDCFGTQGLSLNFNRLAKYRPDYGYRNLEVSHLPSLAEDGVFSVDLENNKSTLLHSIESLIAQFPLQKKEGLTHKVNHIMYSPNGQKFVFLHRYFYKGIRKDRLFLSEFNSLKLLSDQDMISHYCWIDDSNVVGYMRDFERGDGYYNINVDTLEKSSYGPPQMSGYGDGHPIYSSGSLVFDTYPNKARQKELFLLNSERVISKLGSFVESFEFGGETRCDLHPRLTKDGRMLFFDSVHDGRRGLYLMDISHVATI